MNLSWRRIATGGHTRASFAGVRSKRAVGWPLPTRVGM